jgi:hypothetical protein
MAKKKKKKKRRALIPELAEMWGPPSTYFPPYLYLATPDDVILTLYLAQ